MISLEALAVIAPIIAVAAAIAAGLLGMWFTERAERRKAQRESAE